MNAPDLEAWCRNVAAEKINMAMLVPTLLYRLLAMGDGVRELVQSLQTIYYGAAPMSPSKLLELQALLGNIFIQVYGSTEHAGVALSMSKPDHLYQSDGNEHLSSAGRAAPGVELQIMDDKGKPAERGEVGEIWLRSRAICLGYFGDPEQTASEFEDGFWKSGDMGRMDADGFVYVVDRKKDMIISGGFNVYATEVEAAIDSHPAVFMSAVVGIPHEDWGEAIHAEVMLKEGESLAADELKDYVKQQLGGYKSPKTVKVVAELPVSVVGKVLRREVREQYWKESDRKVG
jgi:acyl-CoA synthetase (AMP-forming)/AMP-acid ligase II